MPRTFLLLSSGRNTTRGKSREWRRIQIQFCVDRSAPTAAELHIDEVIELLASLPRQLDNDKTLQEVSLLRNMHVVFERQFEPRELSNLMGLPTARWPEFKLSLRPPQDDTLAGGERVGTLDEPVVQRSPPTVLALLIYELLGGRQRPGGPLVCRRLLPSARAQMRFCIAQ